MCEKLEEFKRTWSATILLGNVLNHAKSIITDRLNEAVLQVQKKINAKKILMIWRRKRVEFKIRKMSDKHRAILRRFFLRIKINIVLCQMQGKSFTISPQKNTISNLVSSLRSRIAARKLLRAFWFFRNEMVKLEEEIVYQWNLKLLKRLSINAMNSALNLPLLR